MLAQITEASVIAASVKACIAGDDGVPWPAGAGLNKSVARTGAGGVG
jgi:hypothetical protein